MRMGVTAATSESNVGEVQKPKEIKCAVLSSAFCTAGNDIHSFGRGPVSVGIVGRKEGYVY
jgi:hypothetical protein